MTAMKVRLVPLLLLALAVLAACGTARRSETLGNAPTLASTAEQRGQVVFMKNCNSCHVGGTGALGPAINDKPLPGFLIRFQVRNGLGAMPAFSDKEISDAALEDLVAYLRALRDAGPADATRLAR